MLDEVIKWLKNHEDRIASLETKEQKSGPLVDYSSVSTIVGWTTFTVKNLVYSRNGNIINVWIDIRGTSNSVNTTFTLPYQAKTVDQYFILRTRDNTGIHTSGIARVPAGSNVATVFSNLGGTGWTASGTKEIAGQLAIYLQ